MTSRQALYKLYSYSLLDNDTEKQISEVIEKDLEVLEEHKRIEKELGIDLITVLKVMTNGIYYYDRYGKVSSLVRPSVSKDKISQFKNRKDCSFYWIDLGVKFWLTEQEAKEKAQEYLNCFPKKLTISKLKKICKMEIGSKFYINEDNKVMEFFVDYPFYDKTRKALVCCQEYYNGLYESSYEEIFPIQDYGKTWALTKEELER